MTYYVCIYRNYPECIIFHLCENPIEALSEIKKHEKFSAELRETEIDFQATGSYRQWYDNKEIYPRFELARMEVPEEASKDESLLKKLFGGL